MALPVFSRVVAVVISIVLGVIDGQSLGAGVVAERRVERRVGRIQVTGGQQVGTRSALTQNGYHI